MSVILLNEMCPVLHSRAGEVIALINLTKGVHPPPPLIGHLEHRAVFSMRPIFEWKFLTRIAQCWRRFVQQLFHNKQSSKHKNICITIHLYNAGPTSKQFRDVQQWWFNDGPPSAQR